MTLREPEYEAMTAEQRAEWHESRGLGVTPRFGDDPLFIRAQTHLRVARRIRWAEEMKAPVVLDGAA